MKSKLHITRLVVGQMAVNCYILADAASNRAIVVDPGDDAEYITDAIAKLHVLPVGIVLTHGHFDHALSAFAIQVAYEIPCMMHPADQFLLNRMQETAIHFLGVSHVDPPPRIDTSLENNMVIDIGESQLLVTETPGHTPGSVMLYQKESAAVFVGDTIFADGAVGRTDHTYSSPQDLKRSIHSILSLPKNTSIYAGHGDQTTVELAKAYHPVS